MYSIKFVHIYIYILRANNAHTVVTQNQPQGTMIDEFIKSGDNVDSSFFKAFTTVVKHDESGTFWTWMTRKEPFEKPICTCTFTFHTLMNHKHTNQTNDKE